MAASVPPRMSAPLRFAVKAIAAFLWFTGCGWLIAHFLLQQQNEFGIGRSPWESPLLHVHGIVAVAGAFLLGWIASRHIVEGWRQRRNRVSGLVLASVAAILVISGYALYYVSNDASHLVIASAHELLGGFGVVFALIHWRYRSAP